MEPATIQFLQDTVGEENVTTALIDMISYSTDASEFKHRPEVAVFPHSTAEVAAVMKMADEQRIPVTPRGAGTGNVGAAVPIKGGIVLDLTRMDKILKISLEDRLAVVQPGVVYMDLEKKLAPSGFSFPPDPASGKVATIGGNVATNAGGVKGAKYGVTKDYVLALEVVLPGGRIMRTGSKTIKCSSGFDLTRLFVGSEGMLGVVTEITLKIVPRPIETKTALATFDELADAGKAVGAVMRSGAVPSVLEIVEKSCIQAINQNTDLNLPEVEAILLVETDGFTEGEAEYHLARIIELFEANNASMVRRAANAEEAEALWVARKSAYGVIARLNNTVIPEDTTVPLSKVGDMLVAVAEIGRKYDLVMPTVGHLGDGNVHPHLIYDRTDPEQAERVEQGQAGIAPEGGGTGRHPHRRARHRPGQGPVHGPGAQPGGHGHDAQDQARL